MILSIFCFHKWRQVNSKGYQYCEKCNKARFVQVPECQHEWQEKSCLTQTHRHTNRITAHVYVLQCKKCGELTKREIKYLW